MSPRTSGPEGKEEDGGQSQAREEAAPRPWRICGHGRGGCECGQIWSLPADSPIARVIEGDWGDEYPAIRVTTPGAIGAVAEPYIERIIYGHVPRESARATAELIVTAVNAWDDPDALRERLDQLSASREPPRDTEMT